MLLDISHVYHNLKIVDLLKLISSRQRNLHHFLCQYFGDYWQYPASVPPKPPRGSVVLDLLLPNVALGMWGCHSLLPEFLLCREHPGVSPALDSAEGSDLARCRLLPNWFVLFQPCRSVGGHRTHGERTRALCSSSRWDVQGCFFPWKKLTLFFTNVVPLNR